MNPTLIIHEKIIVISMIKTIVHVLMCMQASRIKMDYEFKYSLYDTAIRLVMIVISVRYLE